MVQQEDIRHWKVAVDMDGMLLANVSFFLVFFSAMQAQGHQVGILTGRPESDKKENLKLLAGYGITPDFFVGKPDDPNLENGSFKAAVCTKLGIDVLFDDFEADDPQMLACFFSANQTTTPFTSWSLPQPK